MFYVYHGEDEYSIRQAVQTLKDGLGDPTSADLNTTTFDGRSLSIDDLRTTCDTMPFLAEKRLVVVEGLLARYEPRAAAPMESGKTRSDPVESTLRAYLPHLPESALLVFVERAPLTEKNPLLRMARELGGKVKEFAPLSGAELTAWIEKQAQSAGGAISARAAETLAAFVGGNLRQLTQEIDKLVAYAGQRTIQDGDVHMLVADAREVKVWALTDVLAARQRQQAVGLLHQLLAEGEQPPMLMAVITRQFRTLFQMKELADEQRLSSAAIAGQLKMHPFVVQKAMSTVRGFTFDRLDAVYHRLLETDLAVKTGRLDPALALDLLVIELTAPS